jgi:cytochrome P450 family 3 subfamily A
MLTIIGGVLLIIVGFFVWLDLKVRKHQRLYKLVTPDPEKNLPTYLPLLSPDPILGTLKFIYETSIARIPESVRMHRKLYENLDNPTKTVVGSVFGLSFVSTWNPEYVKQILIKDRQKFPKAKGIVGSFDLLFGKSVLSVEGDIWRHQRQILNPSFHYDYIKGLEPAFLEIIDRLVDQLSNIANSSGKFEPYPWMSKMTLDVLGKAGFGFEFRSLTSDKSQVYNDYVTLMEGMVNSLRLIPGFEKLPTHTNREYFGAINSFMAWANAMVENKRKQLASRNSETSEGNPDLLDLLVAAHDSGNGLSQTELLQNIFLFFLAGHETTSSSLTAILHYISADPKLQKLCQEEVDRVFEGKTPTNESVKQLDILNRVINESMRILCPVRALPGRRVVDDDTVLGNYHIPKGTLISINVRSLHLDPDIWGKDADEFSIDRWTPEKVKERSSMSFLPFGAGPRICLGLPFANLEMRLALVKLIQRFEFTSTSPWHPARSITEQPKPGFTIEIKPRK